MIGEAKSHDSIFGIPWTSVLALMIVPLVLIVVVLFIALAVQPAQGQTFRVIYDLTGQSSWAGLTPDGAGNFYGTTLWGPLGGGSVFKLVHRDAGWIFSTLYAFGEQETDGLTPLGRVTLGPGGILYGTAYSGGGGTGCFGNGCGTVFSLRPAASSCRTVPCPWVETMLHRFSDEQYGAWPISEVILDVTGNLYGTTLHGGVGSCNLFGINGCGVVYKLTPSSTGWTQSVLYRFTGSSDGGSPWAGLIPDESGNLFGTTIMGGTGYGTVFQLTHSESGWTESVIHNMEGSDGGWPLGSLVFDREGNLYGTTSCFGSDGAGTAFALSPANGGWLLDLLRSFSHHGSSCGPPGPGPSAGLVIDANGALYGTTYVAGLYGHGNVFKLTPVGDEWIYNSLYDFTGRSDGGEPVGSLVVDSNGTIYGTASGQFSDASVIFEITP